jgi:hypothetical protein
MSTDEPPAFHRVAYVSLLFESGAEKQDIDKLESIAGFIY